MELKDQICSLELAKRLKELNVKQESYAYYIYPEGDFILSLDFIIGIENQCSAFTAYELDHILPVNILIEKTYDGYEIGQRILSLNNIDKFRREFIDTNGVNLRARMLIYLIENKLMELN